MLAAWAGSGGGNIVQNAACQNNLACLLWAIEQFAPLCIQTHPPGLKFSVLHKSTGALMRICVQSIAPILFGSPARA